MKDLLALDSCRPNDSSHSLAQNLHGVSTPLPWQVWDQKLASHPDQEFRKYIVSGLRDGFRIGFDYPGTCQWARRNLLSAMEHPQIIRDYLAGECAAGRVLGPLSLESYPRVHVSPFGIIPKKAAGKWRLIVDLSSPTDHSVNDSIAADLASLEYITVDDAAQAIKQKGAGALLAKVDI